MLWSQGSEVQQEKASPSGPALFKSLGYLCCCQPSQGGKGLPRGVDAGKWGQRAFITAPSAKV